MAPLVLVLVLARTLADKTRTACSPRKWRSARIDDVQDKTVRHPSEIAVGENSQSNEAPKMYNCTQDTPRRHDTTQLIKKHRIKDTINKKKKRENKPAVAENKQSMPT